MSYGIDHDNDMEKLLPSLTEDSKKAIKYALYLFLDSTEYHKSKVKEALKYLFDNNYIPEKISYKRIKTPNVEHQWYSHMGYNYDYLNYKECTWDEHPEWCLEYQIKFLIRKKILVDTVQKVFPKLQGNKIDSVSELFYYVHILGDIRDNKNLKYLVNVEEIMLGLKNINDKFTDFVEELSEIKETTKKEDRQKIIPCFFDKIKNITVSFREEMDTI
jgi:hypothetical protein